MPVYRNINGTQKLVTAFRNIGGTWKLCNVWRNIGGVWKQISVLFTPDGGLVSDDQTAPSNPSVTLSCSVPAVWTFSLPFGCSANIPSGSTATSVNFFRSNNGSASFGVTGTAGAVTRNFTVQLIKETGN